MTLAALSARRSNRSRTTRRSPATSLRSSPGSQQPLRRAPSNLVIRSPTPSAKTSSILSLHLNRPRRSSMRPWRSRSSRLSAASIGSRTDESKWSREVRIPSAGFFEEYPNQRSASSNIHEHARELRRLRNHGVVPGGNVAPLPALLTPDPLPCPLQRCVHRRRALDVGARPPV